MSQSIKDVKCFLCGQPARSATYDRGIGEVFIDCVNSDCGEYLITYDAMSTLSSDEAMRQDLSRNATSRDQIKKVKKILKIYYSNGIQVEMKPLEEALSQREISFLGFIAR